MTLFDFYKIILLCLISFLTGCNLPINQSLPQTAALVYEKKWIDGEQVEEKIQEKLTAYSTLDDPYISIASRLYLIRNAQHSLDLQYYIWKNDTIGQMLLAELLRAADRGVKVRLLIDDQNGTKLDATLKQLIQHPNFEIKLFNPYQFRYFRVFDYLFRFEKINHRMHNKLIIADGAIAVTGGRNISREYFDASNDFQFTDLDLLFYGHSVIDANQVFINFWNDPLSYSVKQWLGQATPQDLEQFRQNQSLFLSEENQKIYQTESEISDQLNEHSMYWAKAYLVADSPNKIRNQAEQHELIYNQMLQRMGEPKEHLEIVSSYFVPTQQGTNYLTNLASKGMKIRILTNSYLANDVPIVHAFYQKYRKELLKSGIQLYEFKPDIEQRKRTWYEIATGNVIPAKNKNTSRLHAKFFDTNDMVFIGSFNIDPRSVALNTEVGVVIDSAELQDNISQTLDYSLPKIAYELKLKPDGQLIWLEYLENGEIIEHEKEPKTTFFQRFMIQLMSILPIEWLM